MRAAIRGRDRITIGSGEPVRFAKPGPGPGDRPFDLTISLHIDQAGKRAVGNCRLVLEHLVQLVGQTIGVGQDRFGGHFGIGGQKRGITGPAHFHAAIEIRLRACHLKQARGAKAKLLAEDLEVRLEADRCTAPIGGCADLFQLGRHHAARKGLAEQALVAGDFDNHFFGQGVYHRYAHAMQAASGRVGLV